MDTEELRVIFEQFDTDKSGSLEIPEIVKVCEKVETPTTEAELRNLFREIDLNQDGKISFDEFLAWFRVGRTTGSARLLKSQIKVMNEFNSFMKKYATRGTMDQEDIDNSEIIDLTIRDRSGPSSGTMVKGEILLGSRNKLLGAVKLAFPEFEPSEPHFYFTIRTQNARQLCEEMNKFLINMMMAMEEFNPQMKNQIEKMNINVGQIGPKVIILLNPKKMDMLMGVSDILQQVFLYLHEADPKLTAKLISGSTLKQLAAGVRRGTRPSNSKVGPESNLLRFLFDGLSLTLRFTMNSHSWDQLRFGGDLQDHLKFDTSGFLASILSKTFSHMKLNLNLRGADNYQMFKTYFRLNDQHIPDIADLADDIGQRWAQMGEFFDQFPFIEEFFEGLRKYAICDTEAGVLHEKGRVLLGFKTDGIDELYDLIVSGFEEE